MVAQLTTGPYTLTSDGVTATFTPIGTTTTKSLVAAAVGSVALSKVFIPGGAETADFYIAPPPLGNDANNGTSTSTPWATLQKAANTLTAGQKALVEDGTYTSFATGVAGTSGSRIIFKSRNLWGAKIFNSSAQRLVDVNHSYNTIDGFEIYGNTNATDNEGIDINAVISGVTIRRCLIHDIGWICSDTSSGFNGILLGGSGGPVTDAIIERNIIHTIGRQRPGEGGCSPATTNYAAHDHALYISNTTNLIVRNNIFYGNNNGWDIHGFGTQATNLKVLNNVFADANPDRDGGLLLNIDITTADIANNIFYQKRASGIDLRSGVTFSGVVIRRNISTNLTHNDVAPLPGGVTVNGDNVESSTTINFVDAAARNYHLLTTSAAKDAGLTLSDVTDDFDGVSRPQGAGYCMGAFEFVP